MNFATYAQDLEQDPFDPIDFVERLAWRMTGGEDEIDPVSLHQAFEEEIYNLQMLSDQYQSKILHLQNQCREEEEEFAVTLERMTDENDRANEKLKQLDDKISTVARKVVHLGEQLENVNAPRSRADDTLSLIKHFNEFLAEQPLESPIFTDPDRLLESAEIIHKLYQISQELSGENYANVKTRILYKHEEIEKSLLEDFARVYRTGNKAKMKAIAHVLSNFSAYTECVNIYIETIQGAFRSLDIFEDIYHICEKSAPVTIEIFPSPEQVTSKLVLNLFHGKLQEHIGKRIGDTADNEEWLTGLYDLYSGTKKLCVRIDGNEALQLGGTGGSDSEFLGTLVQSLFNKYLSVYMVREGRHLQSYCTQQLNRFYDSKGHQKRQMQAGGISDLKRDIQARVFTPESYGGETFISEEVVVNLLQEIRAALQRTALLSKSKDLSKNATQVVDYLFTNLCQEHLEYAVELARHSIPLSDPKSPPESHFFSVVRQCATMSPLIDKLFDDVLVNLVKNTPEHELCIRRKRDVMFSLETKMSDGLDRQLKSICGYIRFVLANEQKMRPDYYTSQHGFGNSPADMLTPVSTSPAAVTVSRYLSKQADRIRDSLDGGNLTATLTELGVRFHRVVLDHIYSCQFSVNGALLLLHDVREWSECVRHWHITIVKNLFELLHSLCNLLAVSPANVSDLAGADRLKDIEPSVIVSFVQLRVDYKSAKLYNEFR